MDRKRSENRIALRQFLTQFISPTRIGFVKIGLSMMSTTRLPEQVVISVENNHVQKQPMQSAPIQRSPDMDISNGQQKKSGELSDEEEALQRFYEELASSDKDKASDSLLTLHYLASTQPQLRQQQIALHIREQKLLVTQHAQVFSEKPLSGTLQAQSQDEQSRVYQFDGKLIFPTQDSHLQSGLLTGALQPLEQDSSAQSYTLQATLQPIEQDTSSQYFSMEGSLQPFEQDTSDSGCILSGKLQPLIQDDWPASCKLEVTLQPICPNDGMAMNSLSGSLQPVEQTTSVPVRSNEEH